MDPIKSAFEFYEEVSDAPPPLNIYGSDVEVVERRLGGFDGPGRSNEKLLKEWCTLFSSELEHIQEEISHWEEWVANINLTWKDIHGMMACCLVSLDKASGVFPVGIGEIIRCLLANCVLLVTSSI